MPFKVLTKEKKREYRNRYYRKHAKDKVNAKTSWQKVPEKLVLRHKLKDVQLSNLLGRSVKATQTKRYKLKKKQNKIFGVGNPLI